MPNQITQTAITPCPLKEKWIPVKQGQENQGGIEQVEDNNQAYIPLAQEDGKAALDNVVRKVMATYRWSIKATANELRKELRKAR